jgi:ATP-dependent RNA helicase RhlE
MPFNELGLSPKFEPLFKKHNFVRPTPVQAQAIPAVLSGRDVVASAETGSGKTAAFLLPIITKLLGEKKSGGTRVLVLVPTRELALQVDSVAKQFAHPLGIRSFPVYGGVGYVPQEEALKNGTDIIIATPGRLLDHHQQHKTRFGELSFLVLDEADRMLDMGFYPDVRRIVLALPKKRQNLLFSATISDAVMRLANQILHDPVRVAVTPHEQPTVLPVGITHAVYPVRQERKTDLLLHLLGQAKMPSVLIFTRTKHRAERLARRLLQEGYGVGLMHGDRTQGQRVAALEGFRRGRFQLLVATDIAARGLDVEKISHVINYDLPMTPEDYIHRVGRTARMQAKGDAFSLVALQELGQLSDIEMALGEALPRVMLPDFDGGEIAFVSKVKKEAAKPSEPFGRSSKPRPRRLR